MTAINFANVKYQKSNTDVKIYQRALNSKGGYRLTVDGVFGAKTKDATRKFQLKQGWTGQAADGLPGPLTFARLGLTNTGKVSTSDVTEPAHNYSRVTYDSKTVNVRTRTMLQRAEAIQNRKYYLVQGSYHYGVAASAGTHDGGGCVDVSVAGMSSATIQATCQALRRVGFAAWHRTPAQGFSHHIHACAIGDQQMASIAREQVQQYFNGKNGLAGHGPDTNAPRPWPSWANKYNN